jgi:pimeloyl-ACP methyl ester carboxylesterase
MTAPMSRQTLVLLPGLLNDAELWRDQIGGLADLADSIVADLSRGETLAQLAEAALAGAPDRFALAGFSLGGYVAQEILRQAPERVERLALLDTAIRPDSPARAAQRAALNRAAASSGQFVGMTGRMLESYIHPSRLADHDLTGRIKAMTMRMGREVFLRQNCMQRLDGEAVLRAYRGPTVLICGEQDRITPPAGMEEIAAITGAPLVIIGDAGHMTPMERPEAVNAALREWLGRAV